MACGFVRAFSLYIIEYEISFGNVFADLGLDQPEELLARAKLLNEVSTLIKNSGLTQQKIAEKLGITQPKVSMLMGGRLSAFSADTLIHYLFIYSWLRSANSGQKA